MATSLTPHLDFTQALPENRDELVAWIERYYRYDHIQFDRGRVSRLADSLLFHPQFGCAYFVKNGAEALGYFILTYAFDIEFGGRHAVVTDLFFDESARRSGAGTQTVEFMRTLCEREKISELLLQVETDNEEAKAFYAKSGFTELSRKILSKKLVAQGATK